jgi:hypothetical protein
VAAGELKGTALGDRLVRRRNVAKKETNGEAIVGLLNTGKHAETFSILASAVALPESERGYSTQDLWTGTSKKTGGDIRLSRCMGPSYTGAQRDKLKY